MNTEKLNPNNNFKAVFNVVTRVLAVKYGNFIKTHYFDDLDEWTEVFYDGDEDKPQYLHIHLHYEEALQLCFYPRLQNDGNLYEDIGVFMNGHNIPEQIKVAYDDATFNKLVGDLHDEGGSKQRPYIVKEIGSSTCVWTYQVYAESEEEAIEKARNTEIESTYVETPDTENFKYEVEEA